MGLEAANTISTPLDPNVNLDSINPRPEDTAEFIEQASGIYAMAIGWLSYASHSTRVDIEQAVNRLAQFTKNLQPKHWTAVKQIFHYLKGTKDLKLTFGGPECEWTSELNIFCDTDWAANADCKSISGYVFMLAGGAVSWSSKKQTSVTLSTAKAKYVAAMHIAKQALWYQSLFHELGFPQPAASTIFMDNQAAIAITHHPEHHS